MAKMRSRSLSSAVRVLVLTVFLSSSHQVLAAEGLGGQEILATAKIAGACGILDAMIHFQKTTRMPGGDEFVARFWAVESARLGMTVQELSQRCDGAVTLYDKLWKAMDAK